MKLFSNPVALSIIGSDKHIHYACQCNEFKPITKLYFCRHCTKLRCGNCVTHEVDSFYCPNCLENMPSAEAKLKKNRCANCFDCPSCGHTLTIRATAVPGQISNPLEDTQKVAPIKKMHYLNCGFCRWTTRDVGIPDQPTPTGGWPELELPSSKKVSALLEYYKHVAHQDKLEKERLKMTKRRTNLYLMDRYGYALNIGKKRAGSMSSPLSPSLLSRSSSIGGNQKEVQPPNVCAVSDDIQPIADSYYTEQVYLEKRLTPQQKLVQPERQGIYSADLYPKHKHLMVRRSQRCKECEHNLCKPEFNPSSIKFKIQLGAMHYCPQLQIVKKEMLTFDKECEVIFSVSNPLDTIMTVKFQALGEDDEGYNEQNCLVKLPGVVLPISAKDATVEFDGIGTSTQDSFDDDPAIVHSRSTNKLCFYSKVKPTVEQGNISATFKMTYEYKMVTAPLLRKLDDSSEKPTKPEEHLVSLTILVRANLGEV